MNESVIRVTQCRVVINREGNDRLKAFASIILNEQFAVCDLKVIKGHTGLFVAMPSRRRRDGKFHDVAHPICADLRDLIEQCVLGEYQRLIDEQRFESGDPMLACNEELS